MVKQFVGRYANGRGMSSQQLHWQHPDVTEYLGGVPHPGSFNIVLSEPVDLPPEDAVIKLGDNRRFWHLTIFGQNCLVYRWPECPMHIVECISLVKLSDFVTYSKQQIDVLIPRVKPIPRWKYFAWQYVWSNPNFDYYSDEYWNMVQRNFLTRKLARLARQSNKWK